MGFLKKVVALDGVDEVADRLVREIEQRKARGESHFWVTFTQREIRGRMASATSLASLVRRKIEKAGHRVRAVEGVKFGDDVRLRIE